MTFREIVSAMLRRWYVVVPIVVLFAGLAVFLTRDGGLYATRTIVSFTLPGTSTIEPENGSGDLSVISFAAAVAQEINGGRPADQYASDDAPFYGAGVRQGVSVDIPNAGGQWTTSFTRADVEIQIVGRTAAWVRDTQTQMLARVADVARAQQQDAGIPAATRITTAVSPLTTSIQYVAATRSTRILSYAALGLASLLVAAWASIAVDRTADRVRRGRSRAFTVYEVIPS